MARSEFTAADLKKTLSCHYVTRGRVVLLHSSLIHLGSLRNVSLANMATSVINIICELIGAEGTLVVLAPNYEYADEQKSFDTRNSPVSNLVGVLNSELAKRDDAQRSANPIFSLAAVGEKADFICNQSNATAFSSNSAWHLLTQLDTRILMLGSSLSTFTMIRYIEAQVNVPYLYHKKFTTPILRDGIPIKEDVTAYLRYKNLEIEYDITRFENDLKNRGVLMETSLGAGVVQSINALDSISVGKKGLNDDPYYFLKNKPMNIDGINQ